MYRISSNRSRVSNTSRGSDFIYSNRSHVSNTSRISNRSRGRSNGKYTARLVGLPGISFCSNKYKTKNLGILNTCSSVNRVVLIQARSVIQARSLIEAVGRSDIIVLIEAGGFYWRKYGMQLYRNNVWKQSYVSHNPVIPVLTGYTEITAVFAYSSLSSNCPAHNCVYSYNCHFRIWLENIRMLRNENALLNWSS